MFDKAKIAYQAAYAAGFRGSALIMAVAIAGAESAFNPDAVGDQTLANDKWGNSIGLWQIRSLRNPGAYGSPDNLRIASKLSDPFYNARVAFAISKGGTSWKDWSTWLNGAYKNYAEISEQVAQTLGDPKKNVAMATGITCPYCNNHLQIQITK